MRGSHPHPGTKAVVDVDEADLDRFGRALAGDVITSEDDAYHDARRVWNGLVNRYPALIVRCETRDDVVAAVRFAGDHDLPVTVRSGGHNVAGTAIRDGCLVVDLSRMQGIDVDPEARRAVVEPGVRLGELIEATQQYGLATPGGMAADTGVAGSTLGGGIGWLRRKYGLGVDNLRSATVVLADGSVTLASADENPDIFWALRGGGSHVGVVTSLEFALHPVGPEVVRGKAYYSAEDAAGVLRRYREFATDTPDEITTIAYFTLTPDKATIPERARGKPALAVVGCYVGPVEDGEQALAPLCELGDALAESIGVTSYTNLHDGVDVYPPGRYYYWKSLFVRDLSAACIDRIVERASLAPSHQSSLSLWQLGGRMNRVDVTETAFPTRDAAFLLNVEATWDDPVACGDNVAWARETWRSLQEYSDGSLYVNFPGLGEEGVQLMRAAYGPNYDRLRALKAKYDPEDRFRLGSPLHLEPATS